MLRAYVVAVLLVGLAVAAKNYCTLCKNHTMCLYKTSRPSLDCHYNQKPKISSVDKDLIVRLHNENRNKVALGEEKRGKNGHAQPPAADMRKIVWDEESATIAQRWASQCNDEHDSCRSTLDGVAGGQNLFLGANSGTVPDWNKTVTAWYDQVDQHDGSLIRQPFKFNSEVEGYTQLVWAKSYAVGCGYSLSVTDGGPTADVYRVVCNYKPLGNNQGRGQHVYAVGKPASRCPAGTKQDSTYKGLCT